MESTTRWWPAAASAWRSIRSRASSHPATNRMWESICRGMPARVVSVWEEAWEEQAPRSSVATVSIAGAARPLHCRAALLGCTAGLPVMVHACRWNSSPSHSCCASARALEGPFASLAGSTTCRTCSSGQAAGGRAAQECQHTPGSRWVLPCSGACATSLRLEAGGTGTAAACLPQPPLVSSQPHMSRILRQLHLPHHTHADLHQSCAHRRWKRAAQQSSRHTPVAGNQLLAVLSSAVHPVLASSCA